MHVAVNNVQGFMGNNVHKDGWLSEEGTQSNRLTGGPLSKWAMLISN